MERDYMERGLHGEVKGDTHGEGTYTERKLHGEGRDSSEITQIAIKHRILRRYFID